MVEFVDGGELFDAVVARGGLAEVDCARIVAQILSALDYMHRQVRNNNADSSYYSILMIMMILAILGSSCGSS